MKKRVVLIEDDNDARLLFKHILTKTGYEVFDLPNGCPYMNAGFAHPDIFVLDNSLPTIDGVALTKYLKLKTITKEIPIIIVSANPAIEKKALTAGASAFIPKPFDTQKLLSTIHQLLADVSQNRNIPSYSEQQR